MERRDFLRRAAELAAAGLATGVFPAAPSTPVVRSVLGPVAAGTARRGADA